VRLVDIDDPADARLDDFRNLTDADVRPDRRGVVIAEGVNVVDRLVRSPYPLRAVAGVAERIEALRTVLAPLDVAVYRVDKWTLSQVAGFRVTRGVLASADRLAEPDSADLLDRAERVVVLEGLNDFENLGSVFRNAAAFGVDAVLLDPQCADPLYRRSVRVSMGHVLQVPFARLAGGWPASLDAVSVSGFRLIALTPTGETALRQAERTPPWALLLGAEGPGLSSSALGRADLRVRIPMAPGVDSLNVATAAAVAFAHLAGAT
jgi:tRNA G18 (ribose-2'-O)-methylase SpoU